VALKPLPSEPSVPAPAGGKDVSKGDEKTDVEQGDVEIDDDDDGDGDGDDEEDEEGDEANASRKSQTADGRTQLTKKPEPKYQIPSPKPKPKPDIRKKPPDKPLKPSSDGKSKDNSSPLGNRVKRAADPDPEEKSSKTKSVRALLNIALLLGCAVGKKLPCFSFRFVSPKKLRFLVRFCKITTFSFLARFF